LSSFQRLSRRFQATFSHLTRLDDYTNYYTGSVAGGQLISPARQLETDLESKTGLALADTTCSLSWRSPVVSYGRRSCRTGPSSPAPAWLGASPQLVREGLGSRAHTDVDARGVVVLLTDSGLDRLTVAAPVHLRGVSDLFIANLDEQELTVLETDLAKVTLDCNFG
jgi:hypothetical protein